jgi:hypothetical protein
MNETIATDKPVIDINKSYDSEDYTYHGDGFLIQERGSDQDLNTIFYYKDQNVDFYFAASRFEIINQDTYKSRDTMEYNIKRMWGENVGVVHNKNIADEHKKIARKNILENLIKVPLRFNPPQARSVRISDKS